MNAKEPQPMPDRQPAPPPPSPPPKKRGAETTPEEDKIAIRVIDEFILPRKQYEEMLKKLDGKERTETFIARLERNK
jgi:hypothetical protein